MTYEATIKEMAAYIRSELQQIEELPTLSFTIDISGRVHDGEIKINFALGNTYSEGGCVKGGNLDEVIREYLRRFGWDKRHQPLELSYVPEPKATDITGFPIKPIANDDIPF